MKNNQIALREFYQIMNSGIVRSCCFYEGTKDFENNGKCRYISFRVVVGSVETKQNGMFLI